MSVSVYKTFSAGEVLAAADLNASLTQFTNNGTDVAFPLTKNVSAGDFTVASLGNATTDTGAANLRNIAILNKSVCDFRLTLTSGTPVTTSDVTAAETVYLSPIGGNCIGLYDGTRWHIRTSAEMSIDVPDATNMYDVFCYDNGGTPTLELTAWTNDTTRATALTTQDGILVKTGATTRRYIGSFYCTTAGNGQTEDSVANRYLWNYYNKAPRSMKAAVTGIGWNYTTNTWRQANASAVNQLNFCVGFNESIIRCDLQAYAVNTSANVYVGVACAIDTTSDIGGSIGGDGLTLVANHNQPLCAYYQGFPGVGKHFVSWNERSSATGTTSWNSTIGGTGATGGLTGIIFA